MFLGNISPLLIIAGMLGLSPDLKSALIQNAMFIAGAVTLVQLYPVWKVGAKLPIVMGTSSGFIGTAKAMGALYGYGALMGASLIGGLFEMVLGFFIKPLRKLFPPVVTSLVIIRLGYHYFLLVLIILVVVMVLLILEILNIYWLVHLLFW